MSRTVARLAARLVAATPDVPEREVSEGFERPACPYCDRELGTAPGHGAIAWKCVQHGTFPASEFDANILDAMQETVEETGGPSIWTAAIVVLAALPFVLYDILASHIQRKSEGGCD